jgi:Xaa-Pro aminopeptidase
MTSHVINRPRAERVLAEAGVDVVVASTYENVFYFSGYEGFVQRVTPATQVYAVLRADAMSEPTLVAPLGDLDMQAQFPAALASVRPYGKRMVIEQQGEPLDEEATRYAVLAALDPSDSPTEALLDVLASLPAGTRIALDERGLSAATRDALLAGYGDRIVAGAGVLDTIRMVKTPEEVRRLEAAALTIESSYEAAIEAAAEGISEAELASIFDRNTVARGSRPHFTVLAFGERGALPNAVSSSARRLRHGDTIRFDIGCKTEQYSSDIARTAVFGEPSEKVARYYGAILAGEQAMIDVMRPGIAAKEVFAAAVEATREAGIPHYRRHHVGHGVGLDTYDPPLLDETTETRLEAGMVFEVETPYYELGFAGLQVEDTVLVTEDGCRLLTRSARELRVIEPVAAAR